MASDKTSKRKRKATTTTGDDGGQKAERSQKTWLRTPNDPRYERRYEPKTSTMALVSVIAMSIGAVLVGAGTYGQWFRAGDLGPHPAAPWLLAGGALILLAVALFGQWSAKPIRVGDAGIAIEKGPGEIERIEWYELKSLLLSPESLTVQGSGSSISIPLGLHKSAAARVLAEAKRRVPELCKDIDPDKLGPVDDANIGQIELEPPQVAGLHCKVTDRIIAFEKDARLCGRCGEVYHKDAAPKRCVTCDALLR